MDSMVVMVVWKWTCRWSVVEGDVLEVLEGSDVVLVDHPVELDGVE